MSTLTRRVLRIAVLIGAALAPGLAHTAEPAWWTQQKATCGLPSGTAYNTWASQGSPCNGGTTLPSGGGGLNAQQQMMLNATGSVLQMMIQESQEEEVRARARQAAQAAKDADVKRQQDARLEEARRRLQGAIGTQDTLTYKGRENGGSELQLKPIDDASFASPRDVRRDSAGSPRGTHPEMDSYIKGQTDAANCKPQNAGGYCRAAAREYQAQCVANYHNGYKVGEIRKNNILEEAHSKGQSDRESNATRLARAPQRIIDTCGVKWIEAYNEGFAGRPLNIVGR